MNKLFYLFIPACLALIHYSCKKSNDDPAPFLKGDKTTINLGGLSGSLDSFSVESNLNWTLSVSPATGSWLKASTASGNGNSKILVTALESNTGGAVRTATITLTASGNTAVQPVTITVTQKNLVYSLLWSKVYGGTLNETPQRVIKTADGGYLIAGNAYSNDGDVTGHRGNGDAWLVKTDASGNMLWQKTYGGSGTDNAYVLIPSSDGGYVIAGSTGSPNGDITGYHNALDGWVMKVDAGGNKLWSKAFGGNIMDFLLGGTATPDGGYVLAGYSFSNDGDVSGHHGTTVYSDAWILKIDGNGNKQWQRSLGGTFSEQALAIVATTDGGYLFSGFAASNDGDVSGNHAPGINDAWVGKLDGTGNLLWQKTFGGTGSDYSFSIVPASDGNYMVSGGTSSNDGDITGFHGSTSATDAWVLKMDGNGNKLWMKAYGGSGNESFRMIAPAADGGYVVTGITSSNDGDVSGFHGGQDAWVLKIDGAGSIQWQKTLGGSGNDFGYAFVPFTDGSFTLLGSTQSNDGDVSGAKGSTDFWLSKIQVQ